MYIKGKGHKGPLIIVSGVFFFSLILFFTTIESLGIFTKSFLTYHVLVLLFCILFSLAANWMKLIGCLAAIAFILFPYYTIKDFQGGDAEGERVLTAIPLNKETLQISSGDKTILRKQKDILQGRITLLTRRPWLFWISDQPYWQIEFTDNLPKDQVVIFKKFYLKEHSLSVPSVNFLLGYQYTLFLKDMDLVWSFK